MYECGRFIKKIVKKLSNVSFKCLAVVEIPLFVFLLSQSNSFQIHIDKLRKLISIIIKGCEQISVFDFF